MSPCVIKHRAKKAYGGIQTQLHTLEIPIYIQVIVSFKLRPPPPLSLYSQLRGEWYPQNTRLGGPTVGLNTLHFQRQVKLPTTFVNLSQLPMITSRRYSAVRVVGRMCGQHQHFKHAEKDTTEQLSDKIMTLQDYRCKKVLLLHNSVYLKMNVVIQKRRQIFTGLNGVVPHTGR